MARRRQAMVYWVRPGLESDSEPYRPVPLSSLTSADALAELREQYALGYYPDDPRRDGSWRAVKVKVDGRYRARTQSGYYDRPRTP